jgi:spermidine/putrescine transport system permease protein
MKRLLELNAVFIFAFLYAPIITLIVFSFNASPQTATWKGFTLGWYAKLFRNRDLWDACLTSVIVAGASTVIATIIGTMTALAIERHRFLLTQFFAKVLYLPVIIPDIVMAIALRTFYNQIRLPLGLASIVIAHVAFNISYVAIVVSARLKGFDKSLEEAALDLGANKWRTFWHVAFPLILPGVVSGALLAFTLSIDDFVITFFTAGVGYTTLPVKIYSMLKFGVTPEINAISTLLLINSVFLVLLSLRVRGVDAKAP